MLERSRPSEVLINNGSKVGTEEYRFSPGDGSQMIRAEPGKGSRVAVERHGRFTSTDPGEGDEGDRRHRSHTNEFQGSRILEADGEATQAERPNVDGRSHLQDTLMSYEWRKTANRLAGLSESSSLLKSPRRHVSLGIRVLARESPTTVDLAVP